ncbi:hypothetical protein GSI_03462 [Ganoderma sinense ZZ0214-1]|uniref:Extracellular membrane protein CFEM domain-containing protein n=1 Tax=Ganoderma sinense ZZ0214-1 TaxID=1077348 RepID=A0A2G8SLQ2_9APHY|nr:hypothetical protein GSI_03462 [Ganoderma sinense ZZ0214-1]
MYALAVLSIAVLAGQAIATPFANTGPLAALLKRQSTLDPSQIPPQCQSQCTGVVNSLNTCTDLTCLCADAVNKGLYNCLECALSLTPDASLLSQAQSSLTHLNPHPSSEYEQACTQGGVAVTPLTLTLPSGGATATGGSSGTHTTAVGSSVVLGTSVVVGTTAAAGTLPAGTINTVVPVTTAASNSNPNPLSKNGAGLVGVSVASVLGAAGVAVAALL